jgi:hypothetical protein
MFMLMLLPVVLGLCLLLKLKLSYSLPLLLISQRDTTKEVIKFMSYEERNREKT